MENSIEEAVKTMEHWVEYEKNNKDKINKADELIYIQEIILSEYKRVLKENREIKVDRDKFKKALGKRITYCNELEEDLFENCNNYVIPKQEIKAKIEELDIAISECIYLDEDDEKYKKAVEKDKLCLLNQKRALQELLEGGQS